MIHELYRIEHRDEQNGMWTVKINDKLVLEYLTDKRLLNMPMPYDPIFKKDNKVWKTGVESADLLLHWFTKKDMKEMCDRGFIIVNIFTDEVIKQEFQTLFNNKRRLTEVDVTKMFI